MTGPPGQTGEIGDSGRIEIADEQAVLPLDDDAVRRVRAAAAAALAAEACDKSLSIALVDDARIRELNRRYLDHDHETDVIAFPLEDGDGDGASGDGLLGEVVVSTETAIRQAAERGRAPLDELLLYVVHGALHLLGYDDHEPDDRAAMHAKEAAVLAACGEASAARESAAR